MEGKTPFFEEAKRGKVQGFCIQKCLRITELGWTAFGAGAKLEGDRIDEQSRLNTFG